MERKIYSVLLMVLAFGAMLAIKDHNKLMWCLEMIPVGMIVIVSVLLAPKQWKDKIEEIIEP